MKTAHLLLLPVLGVVACKPSIPDEYEDLVPEEERSALTKVIPPSGEPSPYDAPSLIVWYDAEKTTARAVGEAYEKQFASKGYERVMECEQEDDSVDHVFAKIDGDKKEVVQFSGYKLTDSTIDGRVVRSTKITGLSMNDKRSCTWTEFAKKLCADVSGDHCRLES